MRRHVSSGSDFEREYAYSRAVVIGDEIFVSGTTGFDYATMTISSDVVAQTERALATIAAALRDAGSSLDDVVRVRYVLPHAADFARCAPALRAAFATALPAATMIEAGLVDARMKIEIEVTARSKQEPPAAGSSGMTRADFERRYPMPSDVDRLDGPTGASLVLRHSTHVTGAVRGSVVVEPGVVARLDGMIGGELVVEAGAAATCDGMLRGDATIRGAAWFGGMVGGSIRASSTAVVVVDGLLRGALERG